MSRGSGVDTSVLTRVAPSLFLRDQLKPPWRHLEGGAVDALLAQALTVRSPPNRGTEFPWGRSSLVCEENLDR